MWRIVCVFRFFDYCLYYITNICLFEEIPIIHICLYNLLSFLLHTLISAFVYVFVLLSSAYLFMLCLFVLDCPIYIT